MAVKYVTDFAFDPSFGFTGSSGKTMVKGYARGGSVNAGDAKSPGSPKRTPPAQSVRNSVAVRAKFAQPTRSAPVTKQSGNVQRMSAWSDFKNGGLVTAKKGISNDTGHKSKNGADGKGAATRGQGDGDLKRSSVGKPSGTRVLKKAGGGSVFERKAGTPKVSPGTKGEKAGGKAMAMGGLARGTSKKRNAAIHAKGVKKAPNMSSVMGALSQMGGSPPGGAMGAPPSMGPPPGMPMGGAPGAPMKKGGAAKRC